MNDTTLTLIDLLVKSTAVLLLGFSGIAFLRRHSAAQRSLIWLATFAVMLVLPLGLLVRPVWTVPVRVVSTRLALPDRSMPRVIEQNTVVAPIAPPRPQVRVPWTVWQWLTAIYLAGVAVLLTFRGIGSWQLRGLRHRAAAPSDSLAALVLERQQAHGIRRSMVTLVSEEVHVPMTWGTLRPVLMLPASCTGWSVGELRAALDHELTHIAHRDAARRWLGTLVTALWWTHPLVWLASRAWKLEQERACDDAVLRGGSDAESYASQLIAAAHSIRLGGFQSAAALVMAMPSGLETRLRSVVSAGVNRSRAGRVAMVMTCASALLLAAVTAFCQAQSVKSDQPMIYITSKFIETPNPWKSEPPNVPSELLEGKAIVLSNPEFQKLMRTLSQRKGVDLMSAPSVTCKPGSKATVEVMRDFVYPTALEADGITPAKFETKGVGVMCSVDPSIVDGGIRLELEPMVREFLGFGLPSQPGLVLSSVKEAKKGELPKALFYERAWKGTATLKPGQCFVQELKQTPGSESFVTAITVSGDEATMEYRQATTPADSSATIRPLGRRVWFVVQAELVSADGLAKDSPAKPAISGPTFTIFGHVARQGKYPLKKDATLKDAVQSAGGLSDFGDEKSIRIERKQGDKKEVIVLELAKDGGTPLQAGDAVIVPETKDLPPLLTKAKSLRLPKITFSNATLQEAVDYLRAKSRELDPDKQGLNIIVEEGAGKTAKVTLDLRDVPLHEALRYVTELSGTTFAYEAQSVIIEPLESQKPGPSVKTDPAAAVHAVQPLLMTKAMKLKVAKVVLKDATFAQAIDYLRAQSLANDPDKQGINIIVKEGVGKTVKLTLELKDVSLHDALMYVAQLGNAELAYEANAVVIRALDDGGKEMVTRIYKLSVDGLVPSAKEWLVTRKVAFGEGAAAAFDAKTHQLIVKNTKAELKKVEALVNGLK